MDLTDDQRIELQAMISSPDVSAVVATRARIVLWRSERRSRREVAALAGVSLPTLDLWSVGSLTKVPPVFRGESEVRRESR